MLEIAADIVLFTHSAETISIIKWMKSGTVYREFHSHGMTKCIGDVYLHRASALCFVTISQINRTNINIHNHISNPVLGLVIICYQVRCMRWSHPSLFHRVPCRGYISHRLIWMKSITCFLRMCYLVRTGIFIVELFPFIAKPYCSDICGYHRCPQTLAEI